MKTLFVCRSNIGRSQMAMELYNQRHPGQAASAGIAVDAPGHTLQEYGLQSEILVVMKELSIDMSGNRRRQLTEPMLAGYDRVVVLAEAAAVPSYLRDRPHTLFWSDVPDAYRKSAAQAREIRDDIKRRVDSLD